MPVLLASVTVQDNLSTLSNLIPNKSHETDVCGGSKVDEAALSLRFSVALSFARIDQTMLESVYKSCELVQVLKFWVQLVSCTNLLVYMFTLEQPNDSISGKGTE